ncbi:ATP-dependent dethiobiotin synthetase BioD [Nonlabens sp. YIK11]|uniref:dethiobiotin synthase n=1 Tax=Nonlabens sp. YIK11 TaxID=1453349 RepID=UPI0006DC2326|nr:dethiobiotin synthase [Nonlabens sp. YIK11]KQC32251.1 ATP-dependent dethiobiotin synthetase BioD [Nonlabens sp. YIK11]
MSSYFITGIGTDVGKTVAAAIATLALDADYWKPIQSGLTETDRGTIKELLPDHTGTFHPESYRLKTPMSPHKAAEIDGVSIAMDNIKRPQTPKNLIIEGAGGLLVPINDQHTIADLMLPTDKIVLISSGYLGSINHTLLSISYLKSKGLKCAGIIYNHVDLDGTIDIIEKMSGVPTIGHMERHEAITPQLIKDYAREFKAKLEQL